MPEKWWLSFNDPDLHTLIDISLEENFTLLAAWQRLRQAEAIAKKAGATGYPDITYSGFASGVEQKNNGTRSGKESYYAGLVASYELDVWGRLKSTRDAARLEVEASSFDVQTAAMTLTAQVGTTWYNLVEKMSQLELSQRQLDTNRKGLEIITVQVRTGKVGYADMLQQQQLIETKFGEQVVLKGQVEVLENQLAALLGKTKTAVTLPENIEFVELSPIPKTGLPAELLQKRPDVKRAYKKILAADKRVAAAIADKYPRLSISARLESSATSSGDLFGNWLASLAANLVGPLFDGGLRQAEVERLQAVAQEKVYLYSQEVLDAYSEVENALTQEKQQVAYIASLKRQLDLSSQAMARLRDKYIQGVVEYQRVLSALSSLQGIEKSLLTAQRKLFVHRIDLCRALGVGWVMVEPKKVNNNK